LQPKFPTIWSAAVSEDRPAQRGPLRKIVTTVVGVAVIGVLLKFGWSAVWKRLEATPGRDRGFG
jgi:hypothetical protein